MGLGPAAGNEALLAVAGPIVLKDPSDDSVVEGREAADIEICSW